VPAVLLAATAVIAGLAITIVVVVVAVAVVAAALATLALPTQVLMIAETPTTLSSFLTSIPNTRTGPATTFSWR
jgi:hypothetical protein